MLGKMCVGRGVGCYNCLLEVLEAIRFCVRSPYALFKVSFGDRCALGIDITPVGGEGYDHGSHQAVARVRGALVLRVRSTTT